MPGKLKSWPRPHFTPGGGDPFLFFVVFGDFDLKKPFSVSKYRSNGPGDWFDLIHLTRAEQGETIADYQTGEIWKKLSRDAPLTAAEAEKAPQAVVLRAEVTDSNTLDYFRDVIGVVAWLLDVGGQSVYDPQRLWLWSADEWRDDVFAPGEARPLEHTVILISEDDIAGTHWLHTRGLRQYGRPDLSVHGVGLEHMDAVTDLIERFIDLQANGEVIAEGQEIRMAGLTPGGMCRHRGNLEDLDFNNVHVEIAWDNGGMGK